MARPQNKHFVKNIATGRKPAVGFYTKFKRVKKMLENVLDLTCYPKIYFWFIYTRYDEEVLTFSRLLSKCHVVTIFKKMLNDRVTE